MTRTRSPRHSDRGSATVLVAAGMAVLLVLCGAAASIGGALVARRRAASIADLSALAGALRAGAGGDACADAGRLATASGGELLFCRQDGVDVTVEAGVVVALAGGVRATARARAKAGPRS